MTLRIDLRHAAVPIAYSCYERVDYPYSQYPDDNVCGCCGNVLGDHLWQLFDGNTVIDCEVA